MKKSNLFITVFGLIILFGMIATNMVLKKEYQKIDLSDPFKNYISITTKPYSVLDISGSNGYPIEIIYKEIDTIKVLRSRLKHFKSSYRNDTLFIQFTGSNVSMSQRHNSNTPPGIIIEKNKLSSIHLTDVHNRLSGFSNQDLNLSLKGNSYQEIRNCMLNTLSIEMKNTSQIEFAKANTVDSLNLKMMNTSVARLENIQFRTVNPILKDSIAFVLSKETFKHILKK